MGKSCQTCHGARQPGPSRPVRTPARGRPLRRAAPGNPGGKRQARNTEAERRACEIRLRAERKAGELLRSAEKAKGGRPKTSGANPAVSAPTLRELGVSEDQSRNWQRLAAVPPDQFNAALADPTQMPTTNGIIRANVPPARPAVSGGALWLWGRLKDFLITDYPQPFRHGTKQEHMAVSGGLDHGAEQGSVSKGPQ